MAHTIKVVVPKRELGKVDAIIEIRENENLLGELHISKGEAEYRPSGVSVNVRKIKWSRFDKIMRKEKSTPVNG